MGGTVSHPRMKEDDHCENIGNDTLEKGKTDRF